MFKTLYAGGGAKGGSGNFVERDGEIRMIDYLLIVTVK